MNVRLKKFYLMGDGEEEGEGKGKGKMMKKSGSFHSLKKSLLSVCIFFSFFFGQGVYDLIRLTNHLIMIIITIIIITIIIITQQ